MEEGKAEKSQAAVYSSLWKDLAISLDGSWLKDWIFKSFQGPSMTHGRDHAQIVGLLPFKTEKEVTLSDVSRQ